jgi:hypothetical protein
VGGYQIMMQYFSRFETLVSETSFDEELYYKADHKWVQDWCEKLYPGNAHTDLVDQDGWECNSKDLHEDDGKDSAFQWNAEEFLVRYLALHNAVLVEDKQISLINPREKDFMALKSKRLGSD